MGNVYRCTIGHFVQNEALWRPKAIKQGLIDLDDKIRGMMVDGPQNMQALSPVESNGRWTPKWSGLYLAKGVVVWLSQSIIHHNLEDYPWIGTVDGQVPTSRTGYLTVEATSPDGDALAIFKADLETAVKEIPLPARTNLTHILKQ